MKLFDPLINSLLSEVKYFRIPIAFLLFFLSATTNIPIQFLYCSTKLSLSKYITPLNLSYLKPQLLYIPYTLELSKLFDRKGLFNLALF